MDVDDVRKRVAEEEPLLADLQAEHAEWMAKHAGQMRETALSAERGLCKKIQSLREDRGWSQVDLARELARFGFEMHQTTVAKLEAGKRPLRVAELFALSNIFGIPAAGLFYLRAANESFGMVYMREELERVEEAMREAERLYTTTLQTYASVYATHSAELLMLTDAMRRAGEDHGEHQQA